VSVTYAQFRDWALSLPGATEVMVEAWGHPTFRVNDKKFAGGGPDYPSVTLKATVDEQGALVARAPETFSVARYVGRYGWVEVNLAEVDPVELHTLMIEAWRRCAPKTLVAQYEASGLPGESVSRG
jgi:hypothetical protein